MLPSGVFNYLSLLLDSNIIPSLTNRFCSIVTTDLLCRIYGNVGELQEGASWRYLPASNCLPPNLAGLRPRRTAERGGYQIEGFAWDARIDVDPTEIMPVDK
jgi:hypothetical protein